MVGGGVESAATYEPYGNLLARSGPSGTVYGFTGEQHDAATGLVYLRARYYNPNLKLFMSRDPFPGWQTVPASQHGYSYVHNNPVNWIDPTGEALTYPLKASLIKASAGAAGIGAVPLVLTVGGGVFVGVVVHDVWIAPITGGPTFTGMFTNLMQGVAGKVDEDIQLLYGACVNWLESQRVQRQPTPKQSAPLTDLVPLPHPTPDRGQKRVLTVGDGDFGYSRSLASRYPDWDITGTNFGDGSNRQTFIRREGNLSLYAHVDATRLESGAVTGFNQYDAIIFNNPYLGAGGSQTASLIAGFKQSARGQLSPVGAIHINVTQQLLLDYDDVARELGLPDNHPTTVQRAVGLATQSIMLLIFHTIPQEIQCDGIGKIQLGLAI